MILYLDTETRSPVPIKHGLYRYAEGPAEVTLLSYAVNMQAPVVVDIYPTSSFRQLQAYIDQAEWVVMHGAEFDSTMLSRYRVKIPLAKQWCTIAQARQHGLPGSMAHLCDILKLPGGERKFNGKDLIKLFCIPIAAGKRKGQYNDAVTHPPEWEAFRSYCMQDVVAMRTIYGKLPRWNSGPDRHVYELDRVVNARGVRVDVEFARAMTAGLEAEATARDAAVKLMTGEELDSVRQRDEVLSLLAKSYGVYLPDLTASTVKRRLEDPDLSDPVKWLLEQRLDGALSSGAKYDAVLRLACEDDRVRGAFVYCGAERTSRWSARGLQFQNMARPTWSSEDAAASRDAIVNGTGVGDVPLSVAAKECVRGLVIPGLDRKLVVADYSAVEARVAAWVAGEVWKLDAFRAYDAGFGPDQYKLSYSRLFDCDPVTVTKPERQIGKVTELFCQYGGSVAAFVTGAKLYNLDLEELAARAWPLLPVESQIAADARYYRELAREKPDPLAKQLPAHVYTACCGVIHKWRKDNEAISSMWYGLDGAVRSALDGSKPVTVRKVLIDKAGAYVRIHLPSGRCLQYLDMRVDAEGLTFLGVSPYTHQWARLRTHGAKLFENTVQKLARDLLADTMASVEAVGIPVVMHAHDEPVCEVPSGEADGYLATLLNYMVDEPPGWAVGLPLAAQGFITNRYYKEV